MRSFLILACMALLTIGCDVITPPATSSAPMSQPNQAPAEPQDNNEKDGESHNTPHFGATLVVNAARKGVNGPSLRTGVGRLSANAHVGREEVSCGPESAVSHVTLKFLEHRDGADHYTVIWKLTDDSGNTLKTMQRDIAYSGEKMVLVEDVHYIVLEPLDETEL